jgi:hypothetical protein
MSRRSTVPEPELQQRLTHCDADQQSAYFCAFRDFIAADLQLDRAAAEQARRHPECRQSIAHRLLTLRHERDSTCAKSARKDYGGGSMEQTATASCAARSTASLIEQFRAMNGCPSSVE